MSSEDDSLGRSAPRRNAGITSGTLAIKLLHGTLASLRCRELIQQGRTDEARVQLFMLRTALKELGSLVLDDASTKEAALLRAHEKKLGVLLRARQPQDHGRE